jgi:Predicted transcriptional regulators
VELKEKLVGLRKEKGLSQLELAELAKVSRQAVSRWEVGSAIPSTNNLKFLSDLYGVPIGYFFDEEVELVSEDKGVELISKDNLMEDAVTKKSNKGVTVWPFILITMILIGAIVGIKGLMGNNNSDLPMEEIQGREIETRKDVKIPIEW